MLCLIRSYRRLLIVFAALATAAWPCAALAAQPPAQVTVRVDKPGVTGQPVACGACSSRRSITRAMAACTPR